MGAAAPSLHHRATLNCTEALPLRTPARAPDFVPVRCRTAASVPVAHGRELSPPSQDCARILAQPDGPS